MTDSLRLDQYPGDMVRLACRRCDRRGQYRRAGLIDRFGADIRLPDLRGQIAECPRLGKLGDACGVYFVDLAPGD